MNNQTESMLHSIFYNKDTYEDPKTSAVFENLMLLPDDVFWHILRVSCFKGEAMPRYSGMLTSYRFWPHWDRTGTDNVNYVEPDLFLRFELFDVIIEAKYGEKGGQYEHQWKQEITAYHNEYGYGKSFLFIAIGGNLVKDDETITLSGRDIVIHKCNWLSLLMSVNKYRMEIESLSVPDMYHSSLLRLLDNIILAFKINGVYNIEWFNTMGRSKTVINESSIGNISKLFNW